MSIVRAEASTMVFGLGLGAALWNWAPALLPWLAPVWVPWSLAIPIAAIASSPTAGMVARKLGLLVVPTETEPDPVLDFAQELCPLTSRDDAARFRDLVLDPVLLSAHLARLQTSSKGSNEPASRVLELRQRALRAGPAALSEAERTILASDRETMVWLHREAWRHWPVESWLVSRDRPQVPPESRLGLA
jgi:membrane glycosyltransferase